jgi:hypothetical protein
MRVGFLSRAFEFQKNSTAPGREYQTIRGTPVGWVFEFHHDTTKGLYCLPESLFNWFFAFLSHFPSAFRAIFTGQSSA